MGETQQHNSQISDVDKPLFKDFDTFDYMVYCPICKHYFDGSEYLKTVFLDDEKTLWFANMVMHYRYTHITSWNKCWGQRESQEADFEEMQGLSEGKWLYEGCA